VVAVHSGARGGDTAPEAVTEQLHGWFEVDHAVDDPSEARHRMLVAGFDESLRRIGGNEVAAVALCDLEHHAVHLVGCVQNLLPARIPPVLGSRSESETGEGLDRGVQVVNHECDVVHPRPTSVEETSYELPLVIGTALVGRGIGFLAGADVLGMQGLDDESVREAELHPAVAGMLAVRDEAASQCLGQDGPRIGHAVQRQSRVVESRNESGSVSVV